MGALQGQVDSLRLVSHSEEETRRKVNGLVQRYLDGGIDMAKVTEEVGSVPEVRREFFLQEMKRNLLERIDPALDHGPILSLLASLPGVDVGTFSVRSNAFGPRLESGDACKKRLSWTSSKKGESGEMPSCPTWMRIPAGRDISKRPRPGSGSGWGEWAE